MSKAPNLKNFLIRIPLMAGVESCKSTWAMAGCFNMLMLVAGASLCSGQSDPDAITWIPETSVPPGIDGEIDDIWYAGSVHTISRVQQGTFDNNSDLMGEWFGLWDEDFLYVLIDVTDQFLESEAGADIWRNDLIEIYFNMDNARPGGNSYSGDNFQYAFNWNSSNFGVTPNGSKAGIEWKQVNTDRGYLVEVKFPWTTLTTRFTPEETWSFGFDIAINDNDGKSVYDGVMYWWNSLLTNLYGNIDGAGTLGLGEPFDGNYSPRIAEVADQIVREGETLFIELTASDLNPLDVVTFTGEGLPAYAQLQDHTDGTASLTLNPVSGDAGIYTLVVSASDGSKSSDVGISLVVKDPNVATLSPRFLPVGETVVDRGNRRILRLWVEDNDSPEVSIEGTDLPDFATLVDNGDKSATLTLTPGGSTPLGSFGITMTVADLDTNKATATIDVQVREKQDLGVYYCDPENGNVNNIGSKALPWSSWEALVGTGRYFETGDVLYLHGGYHGSVVIRDANPGIVFVRNVEGETPELANLTFTSTSGNWHVSGLDLSPSGGSSGGFAALLDISGRNNTVANSEIYSALDTGGWSASDWGSRVVNGVIIGGSQNTVEYCNVTNVGIGIDVGGNMNTARGNRVQYFTVDAFRAIGDNALYEYNFVADNISINENHDDAFQGWTLSRDEVVGSIIRGNTIIQSTDPNRQFQGPLQGLGLFDGMFVDWVIENNVILVDQYHGIALYGAINCKVINNTVIDQKMSGEPGPTWITIVAHDNYQRVTDPDLKEYYLGRDNIVRNNLATRILVSSQLATVDHNIVIRSTSEFSDYFVGYPFNLHLKAGSPAIDAGSIDDAPTLDREGLLRPFDGDGNGDPLVDVGAYEFSTWRNYEITGGWVYTGANYLGWIYILYDNWQYVSRISGWVYSSAQSFSFQGAWCYFVDFGSTGEGWVFDERLKTWIFKSADGPGGWAYVLNTGDQ